MSPRGAFDDEDLDDFDEDFDDEAPFLGEDDEPRCAGCGCSADDPCEGGCVWARPDLCSRCV